MPAKPISINLLGEQDLSHTPWGRMVSWATSWGRYIMITTEIVVLLAFISRFSIDRKLTDLTEEVSQKQAIIEANQSFEQEIKSLQNKTKAAKKIIGEQSLPVDVVLLMETVLPLDAYLTSFEINQNKLTASVVVGTAQGFSQLLANLTSSKILRQVTLGSVNRQAISGIEFQFTADVAGGGTK